MSATVALLPIEVWLHFLTCATFILLFTLPPFRLRRLLLTVATAISTYAFIFLEPASPGPASRLRYLTSAIWMSYIVWLPLMLFHKPEHEFWRAGKAPHEAENMRFGWEKLRWSLSLLSSWRGVGWNVQVPNLPPRRESVGRWRFVLRELGAAMSYYVAIDITTTFLARNCLHHAGETIEQVGWGRRIALTAALGPTVLFYTQFQYAVWSAVLVAVGLFQDQDFLPIFGSLTAATSLAEFWGTFWHQNLRRTFVDYGQALARSLCLPRRSIISWLTHVWTAFLISGLIHSLPFWHIAYLSPSSDSSRLSGFASMMTFYLLQALGLTIEAAFLISPGEDILLYEIGAKDVWFLGRLWTLAWLLFSGQFALECWLRTDPGATTVPYSLVAAVLDYLSI